MDYLISKFLGLLFAREDSFYCKVVEQIKNYPNMSTRTKYRFTVTMPDGGTVTFWIANSYYGFTINEDIEIPIVYKAMLYDAFRECAIYNKG